MHIIIGILVLDDYYDDHAYRHAQRESKNIDQGESFVPEHIPEGCEQVVLNHGEPVGA
jgi:hypothetical protein